jgi:phage tail tube protein FII
MLARFACLCPNRSFAGQSAPRQRRTLKFHTVAQRPHRAGGFTSGLTIAMGSEKSERDVRGESYRIPAYHERGSRAVVLQRRHALMGFQQDSFFS